MQLMRREPDGSTLRQHLQAGAKATGHADPRLLATVPDGCSTVWAAFGELNGTRPVGMGAVGAIPMSEICAWQQLTGVRLSPWEFETLVALDKAAMAVMADNAKRARQ